MDVHYSGKYISNVSDLEKHFLDLQKRKETLKMECLKLRCEVETKKKIKNNIEMCSLYENKLKEFEYNIEPFEKDILDIITVNDEHIKSMGNVDSVSILYDPSPFPGFRFKVKINDNEISNDMKEAYIIKEFTPCIEDIRLLYKVIIKMYNLASPDKMKEVKNKIKELKKDGKVKDMLKSLEFEKFKRAFSVPPFQIHSK